MEVYRARGSAALRLRDVAGTQRNGVSFAKADDDYGDRTCVISGGLGTSTVTYNGKSYYVCCSGCKAAFEDDPETWIAKFEAKKNEKK
ncbi:YHS domain-containing protein [bacterium]|nr:YHS domain-containing protein [bacterium]